LTLLLKWLLQWLLTLVPFCQADAVTDKADQKRNCLSRRRVFALPALAVAAAGTRVAGAGSGVAFFLLTLFLAKQEKVSGCRAAPGYYVRRKTSTGLPKKEQQTSPAAKPPTYIEHISHFLNKQIPEHPRTHLKHHAALKSS
jgi:hypothetical protein